MLRVGKLPPKEYFDKTYTYSTHNNGNDNVAWNYWKTHRDDVDKIREYINEKSFIKLVYFLVLNEITQPSLVLRENKEQCSEPYFTKKYLDIIGSNVADIYFDLGCTFVPEVLKVDGW